MRNTRNTLCALLLSAGYSRSLRPPDTEQVKTCSKCGETKPLEDFPPRSDSPDGRRGHCRPCYAKRKRSPVVDGYSRYQKKYRAGHRNVRNGQRRRNYQRGAVNLANAQDPWTLQDLDRIVAVDRPSDRALALELGRSVRAIQIMRHRVLNSTPAAR